MAYSLLSPMGLLAPSLCQIWVIQYREVNPATKWHGKRGLWKIFVRTGLLISSWKKEEKEVWKRRMFSGRNPVRRTRRPETDQGRVKCRGTNEASRKEQKGGKLRRQIFWKTASPRGRNLRILVANKIKRSPLQQISSSLALCMAKPASFWFVRLRYIVTTSNGAILVWLRLLPHNTVSFKVTFSLCDQ